ncbi:MAG: hypothetical protein J5761_00610, partial [Paludibacteraceae bacterium]|nr:hypothetical protein [Paludibacteraceae bacterium]
MKRYIKEECFRTFAVRICLLILVLLAPIRSFAVGWAPTDAGLIVKFEEYDQFLLSVWIDLDEDGVEDEGEEFFVCDIPSWQPNDTAQSPFNYSGYGNFFKLRRQTAGATKPSDYSIWTVKKSLTHSTTVPGEDANFRLDGICYTMWSQNIDNGNPSKTLVTTGGNFKFLGELTSSEGNANACDVAFAVPTVQARKNMDPDNTLGKGGVFDGATGVGFAGMVYREVYMFMKPRQNEPISYDHFGLVTVNRTKVDQKWGAAKPTDSGNNTVNPGKTAYIYSDSKHNRTTRTLFRLYIYTGHSFGYCPSTYFFAHDEQDVVKYRTNESKKPAAYTAEHKIYTIDHHHCMERVASTSIYKTDPLSIPADDSTYYYIGKNQEYYSRAKKHSLTGTDADSAFSQFRNIRRLRVKDLADAAQAFIPEPGAYGQIVVDTTTKAENLGATFEPAGYFLKVSSGKNIRLIQTAEHEWTTEEVWTITPAWANLQIKATLFTGDKFSEDDPGADIRDWSRMVTGTSIPLSGSAESVVGKTGRARIYTNRTDSNGGLEFFEVDSMHYVRYHNNGHFGSDIPDQYAVLGNTRVMIQEPRLMEGYKFIYWTTVADTTGVPFTKYVPGTTVDLESAPVVAGKHVLDLYAQAAYTGAIHVAISFLKDGKRYFMTNPGQAPRYARARNYKDWTNVWQGMSDINNTNSNYLSTYKIVGQPTCQECNTDEYVLDPHRETMHGSEDSLVFYDKIQPADAEYIGLYFDTVPDDVILSN